MTSFVSSNDTTWMGNGTLQSCRPVAAAIPSSLAPAGYREVNLAVGVLLGVLVLLGLLVFQRYKQRMGRLRMRSFSLLLAQAVGVWLSLTVTLFREWYGRENAMCMLTLAGHYLILPLVFGPMVAKLFVHRFRVQRAELRAGLSYDAVKMEQDRVAESKKRGVAFEEVASSFTQFATLQRKISNGKILVEDRAKEREAELEDLRELERQGISASDRFGSRQDEDEELESDAENPARLPSEGSLSKRSASSARSPKASKKRSLLAVTISKSDRAGSDNPGEVTPTTSPTPGSRGPKHVGAPRFDSGSRRSGTSARPSMLPSLVWWSPNATQVKDTDLPMNDIVRNESTLFGLVMVVLMAIPFIVALVTRSTTVWYYDPKAECLGCELEVTDVAIIGGLAVLLLLLFLRAVSWTWNTPDPLGIVREVTLSAYIFLVLSGPSFVLYAVNAGNVETTYRFTWLSLGAFGIFCGFAFQSFGQVILALRNNSRQTSLLNLFRVLENVELRELFDRHCTREVSTENIRFWDRACEWKATYAQLEPTKRQAIAVDLFRIFVSKSAVMPLNLSHANQTNLELAFAENNPEPASRDVFDAALKEASKLMNDSLSRFLNSPAYKNYSGKLDIDGDALRNQAEGIQLDVSVEDYLSNLSRVAPRPSANVATERRLSVLKVFSSHSAGLPGNRRRSTRGEVSSPTAGTSAAVGLASPVERAQFHDTRPISLKLSSPSEYMEQ